MAVSERPQRQIAASENGTRTRMYTVTNAVDEDAANAQVVTFLTNEGTLTIAGLTVSQVTSTEVDGLGTWISAVTWSIFQRRDSQSETATDSPGERSFDQSMQRQKIRRSLETVSMHHGTGWSFEPNYNRYINVKDGRIEGVDSPVPLVSFRQTIVKPVSFVTLSYIDTICEMIGTTNNASWYGFAAERVIFVRASGSQRGQDDYSLTFEFGLGKHETNINIGNGIIIASKNAWDVVWTVNELEEQQSTGADKWTVETPQFAYVERVFERTNFNDIGIGTTG